MHLCIPGSVELRPNLEATLVDSLGNKNTLRSVKHAFEKGESRFTWRIPTVVSDLTEMAISECCGNPGPNGWPMSVVGAIIGAELQVTVESKHLTIKPEDQPVVGDGSLENHASAQASLLQKHIIECEGFRLIIVQRGGPVLDPARLHGQGEQAVAEEIER